MDSLVRCEKVSKKLGDFELRDISFRLPRGYVLGVIGRNGCGKTTLLRCLTGIYRSIQAGDRTIEGVSMEKDVKAYKKKFVFVSHECPYREGYLVREVGQLYGGFYEGFTMERYRSNLKKLELSEKSSIFSLSQGQKIRVQLAFAMSVDVPVYIFDEPAGNLDVEFRETFYQSIRSLMETGDKTVIYASHLVEELEEIADYILWIKKKDGVGRTKFFGTMDALKEGYRMAEGEMDSISHIAPQAIAGGRVRENSGEWLIRADGLTEEERKALRYADLKEIMYYSEKGETS